MHERFPSEIGARPSTHEIVIANYARLQAHRNALLLIVLLVAACSSNVSTEHCVPNALDPRTGTAGNGWGNAANDTGRDGTLAPGSNALTVRVEDIAGLEIEVVTLACAGDCADVIAVAHGGNPPYRFAWDDGSTNAARTVCLDESATLEISVTDTAIETAEFAYAAHTATSELSARVLNCTDAGAGDDLRDTGSASVCLTGDTAVGDPLGGTATYFRQGVVVPAGRYRVSYVDGCMRFGPPVGWTIHNQLPISWFLVDDSGVNTLGTLPGATGLGYDEFEDCVAESLQSPPLEVDFAGGQLGVAMVDYPLTDNIAGIDGRNPEWCLTPL